MPDQRAGAQSEALSASVMRLRTMARHNQGRRYLEIGVRDGATFFQIDMAHKVAVDPVFQFDVKARQKPGEHYYPLPSDEFFRRLDEAPELAALADQDGVVRFDIIFIDGLHTFEQTLNDFRNSLRHAHEQTLWLIDDTVPSDPYSALPDEELCTSFRKCVGLSRGDWHGDVYKLIYALHDLYPDFSYCTVTDAGNPQTLAWKGPEPRQVRPLFPGLERMLRADYFSIFANADAFIPIDGKDIAACLGKTLHPKDFSREENWKRLLGRPYLTTTEIQAVKDFNELAGHFFKMTRAWEQQLPDQPRMAADVAELAEHFFRIMQSWSAGYSGQ